MGCALIPSGVDCRRFQPGQGSRQQFGIPENSFVVLMVSALETSKRVAAGIRAVSEIDDAYLVIAGDGSLRAEIDQLAATLLPGRFKRLQVLPKQMPALYQSADLFLHLSRIESFGNVFLEALASGLPLVGHDSARTRWIVGEREYLIGSDGPAEIAEQIQRARSEPSVNKQARTARASKFSWNNVAFQYRAFLQEVVGSTQV